MSRAGEEGSATGCGGLRAWGRAGLALRALASILTLLGNNLLENFPGESAGAPRAHPVANFSGTEAGGAEKYDV